MTVTESGNIDPGGSDLDLDVLIARLTDEPEGGTPEDWHRFRKVAAAHPSAWQHLAEAQYVARSLEEEVARAIEPALGVELPATDQVGPTSSRSAAWPQVVAEPEEALALVREEHQAADARSALPGPSPLVLLRHHAGWAAAILLAVAWGMVELTGRGGHPLGGLHGVAINGDVRNGADLDAAGSGGSSAATLRAASFSAAELRRQYIELPEVIRELPPQLIQKMETPEGTLATYLRVFVEQSYVDDTFRPLVDDVGQPTMVDYDADSDPAFSL